MHENPTGVLYRTLGLERRKSERKREFTAGLLAYGGGAFVMDCLIRDIGQSGAQIRASAAQSVSEECCLIRFGNGVGYQAHMMWRHASLMGLSFKKEYPISGALPAHLEFLRTLFIGGKLRQIEQLTANGICLADALSKADVTNATYFRWLASFPKRSPRS